MDETQKKRSVEEEASTGVASGVTHEAKRRYTLDELVDGITPQNRHEEVDWGKAVGREM